MIDPRWIPLGHQQLTSIAVATALTVPAGATFVVFRAETQNVRWRDDGVAPTATVGMLQATSDIPFEYYGNPAALQFIQTSASATLDVAYYK